ncbi:hypothetical protein EVAR_19200_1 [Eumeta japonica]|uniref:Transmembrane protein n=1 Tax=Eumeta variegata TaxID=151549 RepID=A0A4C1VDY4_EUMVA|nr:hypothetical protein EVAR_19200_1 [Eumeta japonica]
MWERIVLISRKRSGKSNPQKIASISRASLREMSQRHGNLYDASTCLTSASAPARPPADDLRCGVMQFLTVNFLIMFDVVFIFFLFLIAVTCVMNYMPGRRPPEDDVTGDVIPPPPLFDDDADEPGSRDTYVIIPPVESAKAKPACPVHVV